MQNNTAFRRSVHRAAFHAAAAAATFARRHDWGQRAQLHYDHQRGYCVGPLLDAAVFPDGTETEDWVYVPATLENVRQFGGY